MNSLYGTRMGTSPQNFAHAGLILAWGANIHGNNIHLWPFIEEARRNGASLPVAALVDQFYADVQAIGGGRWDTSALIARLPSAKRAETK